MITQNDRFIHVRPWRRGLLGQWKLLVCRTSGVCKGRALHLVHCGQVCSTFIWPTVGTDGPLRLLWNLSLNANILVMERGISSGTRIKDNLKNPRDRHRNWDRDRKWIVASPPRPPIPTKTCYRWKYAPIQTITHIDALWCLSKSVELSVEIWLYNCFVLFDISFYKCVFFSDNLFREISDWLVFPY